MDPITQGALGAGFAQTGATKRTLVSGALLGAMAGMAPDLDVLIQSPTDPLLFLEYHRQFTHSLVFIPIGALICATVGYWFARKSLSFIQCYGFCLMGYATHALLDACTSYGTLLFWPFSHQRVDWSNISVVDPLFTVPLLVLVILAARRRNRNYAFAGLVWAACYLGLGVVQRERAETLAHEEAAHRGLELVGLQVKPAFGNLLLWRAIAETHEDFHIFAVRVGLQRQVIPGGELVKVNLPKQFPWLQAASQQAQDLERFRWFSQGFIALHPTRENTVVDVRYSMLPNGLESMWQVQLDPAREHSVHIGYSSVRNTDAQTLRRFDRMLFRGEDLRLRIRE